MTDLFTDAIEDGRLEAPARPPYRIPSMSEIRERTGTRGRTWVSSFSGCGGSSTGARWAGFNVPYAIEFIPAAADTYEANSPTTVVDRRDVRQVSGEEILDSIQLPRGELDTFEGSPPCSSFSRAGSGKSGWGKVKKYSDSKQRTDDLFDEYLRLIDELRPRTFVAENVTGMTIGEALEYARYVTGILADLGYRVAANLLNAANFGVPQKRERLIFVGVRRDLEVVPWLPGPTTSEPYTLREALDAAGPNDPNELREVSMEKYAVGTNWHNVVDRRAFDARLAAEGRHPTEEERLVWETRAKGPDYFMTTVPFLDAPCPTVTATAAQVGAASVMHPTECRKFTSTELRAICGFPKDFELTGDGQQRRERMGRAVPPPMMRAVAEVVARILDEAES